MGWSYGYLSIKEIKNSLLRVPEGSEYKIIKSTSTHFGKHFWIAYLNTKTQESFIGLALIQKTKDPSTGMCDWGYKAMDETMGPFTYDCPLEFLEITKGVPNNTNSIKCRENVKKYWEKGQQTFILGDDVEVYEKRYTIIGHYKRSYKVRDAFGKIYKCSAKKMTKVTSQAKNFIITSEG